MEKTSPTSPPADGALADVFEILELSAPLRWSRITFSVLATVLTYKFTASAIKEDGTRKAMTLPENFDTFLDRLRGESYEPGRGTWFSAAITLEAGKEPVAEFNYDEDPAWNPPIHPQSFARDLEFFPRDEEHVPDWLRAQLDKAQLEEAGNN